MCFCRVELPTFAIIIIIIDMLKVPSSTVKKFICNSLTRTLEVIREIFEGAK